MPCAALPTIPKPSLPSPLTLGATIGLPGANLTLCCNISIPAYSLPLPTISVALPSGLISALSAAVDQINAFIDSLGVECPLD